MRVMGLILLTLVVSLSPVSAYQEYSGGPIVVNEIELTTEEGYALMQAYGVIPAGNYWYDPLSGLWGNWGGPAGGQISPGLPFRGSLSPNASGGGTGVFINGREIHTLEFQLLQQTFGSVTAGRYWMNAQWIGGVEGGPPAFNLQAAAGVGNRGGGSGYNINTYGGSLMSDGNCSAYLHPSGASVMSGNCQSPPQLTRHNALY